jgi:D-inositol-3-phosphate glycosyltransferase
MPALPIPNPNSYFISHRPLLILCLSKSWGGLEMNTVKIAKAFEDRGRKCILICMEGGSIAKAALNQGVSCHFIQPKFLNLLAAGQLSRIIGQYNNPVVLTTDNKCLKVLALLRVLTVGSFEVIYQQHLSIGVSKKDWLRKLIYAQISAWISPLQVLKKNSLEFTPIKENKISVIPIGLDAEKLGPKGRQWSTEEVMNQKSTWQLDAKKYTVGLIGRIDPSKGQQPTIDAIKRLCLEGYPIQLLLLGNPTQGEWLDYTAKVLDEVGQSPFLQRLPHQADVRSFYEVLDLLIVPSFKETYGMVTLEGMYHGIPVMSTNAGGSPEILEDGELGFLVPKQSAEDIYLGIKAILDNPNYQLLVKEKAAKAMAAVDHYLLEHEMAELGRLINSLG